MRRLFGPRRLEALGTRRPLRATPCDSGRQAGSARFTLLHPVAFNRLPQPVSWRRRATHSQVQTDAADRRYFGPAFSHSAMAPPESPHAGWSWTTDASCDHEHGIEEPHRADQNTAGARRNSARRRVSGHSRAPRPCAVRIASARSSTHWLYGQSHGAKNRTWRLAGGESMAARTRWPHRD